METTMLGGREFPVVPQKHARLRHRLSAADFEAMMSQNYGVESHRVLSILIPALVPNPNAEPPRRGYPVWEWEGYVSEDAMKAGEYDEDNDPSPTTEEIVAAFEKVLMVNGADRLGKILDAVSTVVKVNDMQAT